MTQFIMNNIASIIVVVIFIVAMAILYKMNKKDLVKKIILALVVQAEKNLGSGTGALKYAEVLAKIYEKLPLVLRLLYSSGEIDQFIEEGVALLKKMLESGKTLTGYDDENYIKSLTTNIVVK